MHTSHLLFMLLVCLLLLFALLAIRRANQELDYDCELEQAESAEADNHEAYPLAGPRMLAILSLMTLQSRLHQASRLAAQLPQHDPLSEPGRQVRIIQEQLRISRSFQEEALRRLTGSTAELLEEGQVSSDAKWALTAANLSLSFAEQRLDSVTVS